MKKKITSFLALLACLVLVFSMTVFAADSPSTGTMSPDTENNSGVDSPDTEDNSGTNSPSTDDNSGSTSTPSDTVLSDSYADGVSVSNKVVINGVEKEVTITLKSVSAEVAAAANEASKSLVGANASVLKVFDLELPDGDYSAGVNVTINVPGVVAGQDLAVLHQKDDGSWESLPVVAVENGKVTATFTSFSPVAIVSRSAADSTGANTSVVVALVLVGALAGAAYCSYRRVVAE